VRLRIDRSWDRPAPTREQVRTDVLAGVALAVLCVASVEVFHSANGASLGWRGVEGYLWFALAGLALAGRRAYPLTTLVVESVVFVVVGERMLALGTIFTIQMIMFAALYSAWAWSRRPRALTAVTAAVLAAMFGWLVIVFGRPSAMPPRPQVGLLDPDAAIIVYSLAINVVYFLGAIVWGQAAWQSARRRALVEAQVENERRRLAAERREAVQAERVRIARDLHDVVAHHVSGIGVQAAGAARLLERRPEAARDALTTIETASRQASVQMQQLVSLLRDPEDDRPAGRAPQPGLDDLAGLVASSTDPAARLDVVGEPRPVDPAVGLSLFRVVQEALTNVRRHSTARHARATLRYLEDEVEVEVLDDGSPLAGGEPSGGHGLLGIRERAAAHGGHAEVGPRPQGGFRVRVRVPAERGS
jgi:signal transduction histidine kinase